MRRRFALLTLASFLVPMLAHADIARPRSFRRVSTGLRLIISNVTVQSGDAPQADKDMVRTEVRRALAVAQRRIDQCAPNLAEDPLRSRTRTLTGTMTFARSGRPSQVSITRSQGIPAAAEACVLEAARAIQVPTVPRGNVTLTFSYRVSYS